MALGPSTFSNIGGAISDFYAASGARSKAEGDRLEAQAYDLAANFAEQNVGFTKVSTALKDYQQQRAVAQTTGEQMADVATAGFAEGGSALDVLRDSVQQGALEHQTTIFQGAVTEASYEEQAQSYRFMASAARMAAQAEEDAAKGDMWGGILKGVAAVASIALAVPTGGASLLVAGAAEGSMQGTIP